jgi:hypothetical protein
MRRLVLLLILLLLSRAPISASPQQAQQGINPRGMVESVELSGVDEDTIGKDLRDAIHRLEGKPFDQNEVDGLVARLQAEQSTITATVRLVEGSDSNRVKVLFVIEKTDAQPGADSNVNSRYTVERVDIQGFDQSKLSQAVRDDIQQLVGEKLDQEKANQVLHEINQELQPKHFAVKKVMKGSDPQHVIVTFDIHKTRLIPFVDVPLNQFVYHSKQNFSFDANVGFGKVNRFYFGGNDDQDLLIERFAGFNLGAESREVGTDHLGLALRYARFHERWQPSTVLADKNGIYRERNSFDPSITFAFDPRVRIIAGVNLSQLQIQYPAIHDANSNAAIGSIVFNNIWSKKSTEQHSLEAEYDFHSGNHELDSDFIYQRHLLHAQYAFAHNKNRLFLSFQAGKISGNAPLFERFSLGNTSTLRGWNKFDITPAGGNRMLYGSVQYGFGKPEIEYDLDLNRRKAVGHIGLGFHLFYDVGAVGNSGSPIQARHSAGFGFGSPDASSFFIELGFPIRSTEVEPTFSMGFRF